MHHDQTNVTIEHDTEDDVQGFLVVAPRDPGNGLPTLESLLRDRLAKGLPVFPTGPIAGPLLRG
jgi:hypothetical protein